MTSENKRHLLEILGILNRFAYALRDNEAQGTISRLVVELNDQHKDEQNAGNHNKPSKPIGL